MSGQGALSLKSDEGIGSVERALLRRGVRWVYGVDEAGRGPLAGPVSVGAVLLDLEAIASLSWLSELDDSKRLTESRREELFDAVRADLLGHVEWVPREEIDTHNILWASMRGMGRAVRAVRDQAPEAARGATVMVDGNRPIPDFDGPQTCLVRGDGRSWAIAAASVLAKVARDREMVRLDGVYPGYGFAKHKGYPTAAHRAALMELGACPAHRRSFAPVRAALARD